MRCSECGETRNLNRDGVCSWRAGCEHRVAVGEGRVRRVLEEVEDVLDSAYRTEVRPVFLRILGIEVPEDDE